MYRGLQDPVAPSVRFNGEPAIAIAVSAINAFTAISMADKAYDEAVAGHEDAVAETERPNIPGTVNRTLNWCLALPVRLDEIEDE